MAFWCIISIISGILSVSFTEKNIKFFFAWSGDLVDVEGVILVNSEYSVRVIWLVSFYCIVTQTIWCCKIWNMTKTGGTICISVPHFKFWGTRPHVPLICAHWSGVCLSAYLAVTRRCSEIAHIAKLFTLRLRDFNNTANCNPSQKKQM